MVLYIISRILMLLWIILITFLTKVYSFTQTVERRLLILVMPFHLVFVDAPVLQFVRVIFVWGWLVFIFFEVLVNKVLINTHAKLLRHEVLFLYRFDSMHYIVILVNIKLIYRLNLCFRITWSLIRHSIQTCLLHVR